MGEASPGTAEQSSAAFGPLKSVQVVGQRICGQSAVHRCPDLNESLEETVLPNCLGHEQPLLSATTRPHTHARARTKIRGGSVHTRARAHTYPRQHFPTVAEICREHRLRALLAQLQTGRHDRQDLGRDLREHGGGFAVHNLDGGGEAAVVPLEAIESDGAEKGVDRELSERLRVKCCERWGEESKGHGGVWGTVSRDVLEERGQECIIREGRGCIGRGGGWGRNVLEERRHLPF